MPELENRLRGLAADVGFPPTPALAEGVAARLEPRSRWRDRVARRRLVLVVAVVLAAFAAVLAASPGARSAFLELFGIEGATVYRVDRAPDVNRFGPLVPGEAVTLAEARRHVEFTLLLPRTDDGKPIERVFLDRSQPSVTVVYCCPTVLLTQFLGQALPYVQKIAGPDVHIEQLTVDGSPGVWIEGAHGVLFSDQHGNVREDELRLARKALLWERDGITLRLEGDLTRDEALELAHQIR